MNDDNQENSLFCHQLLRIIKCMVLFVQNIQLLWQFWSTKKCWSGSVLFLASSPALSASSVGNWQYVAVVQCWWRGNWTTRGYTNSRTGHLTDCSTRGLDKSLTGQLMISWMPPAVVLVVLSGW